MKFRYKRYDFGVLRPVIPIEIIYKGKSVSYEVLVDSGADFSIFDAQIGDLLGIDDIESGEKFEAAGITGIPEPFYVHPVTFNIGGKLYDTRVGFLPNIAPLGYGVVGQKEFFEIFIVKFDFLKEEIELKERK